MATDASSHREIVKGLLASKAVDFAAIGKAVAELGPGRAVLDEPWEEFCGTMKFFIRIYRLNFPSNPLENLGNLSHAAGELHK